VYSVLPRYPRHPADLASGMKIPVLMLHGTADNPADGGTEFTDVEMARSFERALSAAGKTVDAVYYEGGRHNDIFDSSVRYQDELLRMSAFWVHHLCRSVGEWPNHVRSLFDHPEPSRHRRPVAQPGVFPDYPAPVIRNTDLARS
jgi:acetyl esterase/lipase